MKFDLLRACFWLLAFVIGVEVIIVGFAGASCVFLLVSDRYQIGACDNVGNLVRNIFSDLLAAILALIVASRGGSPPSGRQDERRGGTEKGEDNRPPPRVAPSWGLLRPPGRGLSSR